MIRGAYPVPGGPRDPQDHWDPQDPQVGSAHGDHVLQGSLDGQVGSLIKALKFLDYCCLRTEVEGAGVLTPRGRPPGANLA